MREFRAISGLLCLAVWIAVIGGCAPTPAAQTPLPPVIETRLVEATRIVEQTRVVEIVVTATPPPSVTPDTFVFGAQGEPLCLDPALAFDETSSRIINQVFEGLVRFDKDTTTVVPGLAEKWTASDDGKTWTFTLRKAKFHDGTDFNADAVVKNFDYWKNSKNPLHAAQVKAGQTFEYFQSQFGGFDADSLLTKVEATSPTAVKVTLRQPLAPFLSNMAIFAYGFWSPTALEKAGVNSCKTPVGTGPYKFVEWKPNESVTLEAFADYWDKANAPKMKRVIVRNIPNNSSRLLALAAGEIHGLEGMEPRDIEAIKRDSRFNLLLRPANSTGYVAFNYKVKEFQDTKVRQAFASAINKASIVDKFYGGTGMVAKEFQPPSLWGYNKDLVDRKYDLEAAKKLLADAGYPNGISEVTFDGKRVPLEFWYMPVSRPYFPNAKDVATAIAADWAKAGITVTLKTVDWPAYLEKRKNGQMPLYMLGWPGDNGDPDNYLCYHFCLDDRATPLVREGHLADKEVSDLLEKAQGLTKESERAKLYQQAEKIIFDKTLRIFISHSQVPIVLSQQVEGYVLNPTGAEYLSTIMISQGR